MCLWLIYLVIIWACIHYTNRQSIVSEACTVHLLFPSLTLCRTPFVSSTVNVFGRPHAVCAQTWIRWKTHITAGIINPTRWQTSVQCPSLTCCFTSDTLTEKKDGAHSDHEKLLMLWWVLFPCFLVLMWALHLPWLYPLHTILHLSVVVWDALKSTLLSFSVSSQLRLSQGDDTLIVLTNLVPFK